MRRLESKVILVAGGGSIGGGLARRFGEEGAAVVVGDIDPGVAQAIADDIAAGGGTALATRLDGADEASVDAAVALACETFGGLDGLHANFATFVDNLNETDVLDMDLAVYDEMMRVNARGFLLCTRAALPALRRRGGGSIVYTSSVAAYIGELGRVGYGMSKAAGHALMRHVARKFGPERVRANVIAPGFILNQEWPAELVEKLSVTAETRLIKRPGVPSDIAAVAALLMSDEGSYITGQVINVDGGKLMRA